MRLPYLPLQFTTDGGPADPRAVDAAVGRIARRDGPEPAVTDVLVLAHGWNNDMRMAEELFTGLADNVDRLLDQRGESRSVAVVGVLWPSVRWADSGTVAGGGLSAGEALPELLDRIAEAVPDPAAAAELSRQAGALDSSPEARAAFVEQLRRLLPPQAEVADDDAPPEPLLTGDVEELFQAVAEAELAVEGDDAAVAPAPDDSSLPPGLAPDLLAGETVGVGLRLRDLNPVRLAKQLLNTTTYYTMKDRAGKVGSRGVAPLLDRIAAAAPGVRLHLAGHSFGARVVAMAASVSTVSIDSVTLLQGALSHHGLAGADQAVGRAAGAFRPALERGILRGPVVITHTRNDKAVGLAYAVASRLARQAGSGLGDANDPYGGLGANGAVATIEAVEGTLGDERTAYAFVPGRVHNLRADRFVADHGDVRNPAVASALMQAMLTAR